MRWVISFDIAGNKRRREVVRELLAIGFRVQESVFEADLERRELESLNVRLETIIDHKDDSVRCYALGCPGPPVILLLGCARPVETKLYRVI